MNMHGIARIVKHAHIAFLLALVVSSARTQATTIERMSLEQLVAAANAIVEVQCLRAQTRLENKEIWTFAEFEVVSTRKGVTPRLITVRLLGGQWGHLTSHVEGVPVFHAGEEAILFLQRTRAGDFAVTSWMQGTFRVRRDVLTGAVTVTQDSSALAIFDPVAKQFRHEGIRRAPLMEFRKRLDEIVAKNSGANEP